jgi:hypothetical protein
MNFSNATATHSNQHQISKESPHELHELITTQEAQRQIFKESPHELNELITTHAKQHQISE